MWWWWLLACGDDELVPELFNADDQDITVLVQPECTDEELAPASLTLLSNVAKREIGIASVSPGCGPVGTDHDIVVEVFDDWQELVDEARVVAIPEAVSDLDGDGERDARDRATYTLERDLSDIGLFALELRSLGAADEAREDRWRIRLLTFPEDAEDEGGLLPTLTQ